MLAELLPDLVRVGQAQRGVQPPLRDADGHMDRAPGESELSGSDRSSLRYVTAVCLVLLLAPWHPEPVAAREQRGRKEVFHPLRTQLRAEVGQKRRELNPLVRMSEAPGWVLAGCVPAPPHPKVKALWVFFFFKIDSPGVSQL